MGDPNMSGAEANKGFLTQQWQELDLLINQQMERRITTMGAKYWECITCGKTASGKNDIFRHIESTHVDSPGIDCYICGKHSKTRNALRKHIYVEHNVKFQM